MKRLFIIVLLFIVLGGGGFITYRMFNQEKLNPEIASFYNIDAQAYAADNGYIGLMGVNAPANTQNTYEWALQLVQSGKGSQAWDAVTDKTMPQGDITKITSCWLNKGWKYPKSEPVLTCDNLQDVVNLINANNPLLARYHSQFGYNHFIDVPQSGIPFGSEMIKEHELFLAYLISVSPTHPEEALQEWMKNAIFIKKALADENSLITRSILMVMYGQTQKVLPSLLGNDATLAIKYEKPLMDILAPFGPKEMNIAATVRMDYQLLGPTIRQFDPHNQNKFYQFSQDEIALAKTPPPHFAEAQAKFKSKYGNPKLPAGVTEEELKKMTPQEMGEKLGQDTVMDFIIAGAAVGGDLFKAMSMRDATNRILNLYVQMRAKAIAPDQIATFIKATPANLYDPFTEQPFGYDADSKLIYFSIPDVPDSKQGLVFN